MVSTNNMKLEEILRMEKPTFVSSAVEMYLHHSREFGSGNERVSADELQILIDWCESARTNSLFLEQLFQGFMVPVITDGEIEFY